ncbi:MAG: dephospho-CoA kinase [Lachnospiraceae bacterium]|nr:dephospho-CoA kinase [Lachnospiraceae bacterium]
MKVIGITGGVGSGKSSIVKEMAKRFRCRILMADDAAHAVYLPGNKCYDELVALLSEEILDEDGSIDKKKMSSLIFDNEELLSAVNSIVHPAVKIYILDRIDEARKADDCDFFLLEAALLIECGYNDIVDEMWFVYASDEVRRERLRSSRGYSDEKIDSIMRSQLSDEEFIKGSDFMIDNSFSIENSIMQIEKRIGK